MLGILDSKGWQACSLISWLSTALTGRALTAARGGGTVPGPALIS